MERKAELSVFGGTRRLGDLVRVIRGLHSADDATQFVDNPGLLGVAVVDGGRDSRWLDRPRPRFDAMSYRGRARSWRLATSAYAPSAAAGVLRG